MNQKPKTNNQKPDFPRTAVVLLNMGAAASPDVRDVRDFLFELFSDPGIIHIPFGRLIQRPVARLIAGRRAPKVAPHYAEIGGSPLLAQTQAQARALSTRIGLPVRVAMRYSEPRAEGVVRELAAEGIRRVIALPMYPQYSRTTTASSLDELHRFAARQSMEVKEIKSYPTHEKFIGALMAKWDEKIGANPDLHETHVLLAAHGIPISYVSSGDPYIDEVRHTANAVRARLPHSLPVTVAYQSRVGPVKWMPPFLDDEVRRLGAAGCRKLVVFPITFVSEHLETLWELDIFVRALARESGIAEFVRIPTVQDHPLFIESLAEIISGLTGES